MTSVWLQETKIEPRSYYSISEHDNLYTAKNVAYIQNDQYN